ncbi:MAG TPA: DMT family transporter [Acidimicrobiia bacterium]
MAALFSVLSSITFGVSDFIGGLAARRVATLRVVVWSEAIGLATILVAAPLFGPPDIRPVEVAWAAAAGVVGAMGFLFLFEGLAKGRMAVVSPTTAVMGAALPVAVGLVSGERPALLAWLGVGLALPAVWMVSAVGGGSTRRSARLELGVAAGIGFGLFFVFMAQTSEASGMWPLAVARAGALGVMLPLALGRRVDMRWPGAATGLVVAVGVGDIAANAFFLVAVRSGLMSLVAVLSSLYPIVTVLLARFVNHEPLRAAQAAGVVLSMLAVAMISAA